MHPDQASCQDRQLPLTGAPVCLIRYVALGTLVEGAPRPPEAAEVLCVRADLAQASRVFDSPAWRWDPPALQARCCPWPAKLGTLL